MCVRACVYGCGCGCGCGCVCVCVCVCVCALFLCLAVTEGKAHQTIFHSRFLSLLFFFLSLSHMSTGTHSLISFRLLKICRMKAQYHTHAHTRAHAHTHTHTHTHFKKKSKPTPNRTASWETPQGRTYWQRGVQVRLGLELVEQGVPNE